MAETVADRIHAWFNEEHTKWELGRDVIEWARDYGSDARRAWLECPRADFLMALAGAFGVERELVVRAICSPARDALQFVPKKHALARKAVYAAESYRPIRRAEPPKTSNLAQRTVETLDGLEEEEARIDRATQVAWSGAREWIVDTVIAFLAGVQAHRATATAGASPTGPSPKDVVDAAELLGRILAAPELAKLRARISAHYLFYARAHAVRAAASTATVAESAAISDSASAFVTAMKEMPYPTARQVLGISDAERFESRSGARVYSEAACVFDHAAAAFGCASAAEEPAFAATISKLVTALLYTAGGAAPEEIPLTRYKENLHAVSEAEKARRLLAFAEHVRATVPFPESEPPQENASATRGFDTERRATLRRAIVETMALVRVIGAPGDADIHEAAVALLDAPGPLNRKAFLPLLHKVHERMAEMFRRRAAETTGAAHEEALGGVDKAEAALRELDQSTLGTEEPN